MRGIKWVEMKKLVQKHVQNKNQKCLSLSPLPLLTFEAPLGLKVQILKVRAIAVTLLKNHG